MEKKEALKKLAVYDNLISLVTFRIGWTWNEDACQYMDTHSLSIGWDESDSYTFTPIVSDKHSYGQINVWGDGTLEIQDETGESINWNDFTLEFLTALLTELE